MLAWGTLVRPYIIGACILLFPLHAAAQQTLTLTGTAVATCALTPGVTGAITLNSDLMSWSTTLPATLTATNMVASTLTVTRASDWAVKPTGTPTTTFDHQPSVSGANTIASGSFTESGRSKSALLTNPGVNVLSVLLSATAAAPFKAGIHTAELTVTCATP